MPFSDRVFMHVHPRKVERCEGGLGGGMGRARERECEGFPWYREWGRGRGRGGGGGGAGGGRNELEARSTRAWGEKAHGGAGAFVGGE